MRSTIVQICAWCPELHILRFDRQPEDLVLVEQTGKHLTITRNGALMTISHGVCEPCRQKELANMTGNSTTNPEVIR
jgi:hypothetical protein